jgi:hypothetical protein
VCSVRYIVNGSMVGNKQNEEGNVNQGTYCPSVRRWSSKISTSFAREVKGLHNVEVQHPMQGRTRQMGLAWCCPPSAPRCALPRVQTRLTE